MTEPTAVLPKGHATLDVADLVPTKVKDKVTRGGLVVIEWIETKKPQAETRDKLSNHAETLINWAYNNGTSRKNLEKNIERITDKYYGKRKSQRTSQSGQGGKRGKQSLPGGPQTRSTTPGGRKMGHRTPTGTGSPDGSAMKQASGRGAGRELTGAFAAEAQGTAAKPMTPSRFKWKDRGQFLGDVDVKDLTEKVRNMMIEQAEICEGKK